MRAGVAGAVPRGSGYAGRFPTASPEPRLCPRGGDPLPGPDRSTDKFCTQPPPSASARPLSGIFSDCSDRPKTAHTQRRMPPPKMLGCILRHSSAPEGRSAIGLKTAALNELHPKTIRENAETEYRPNARFLNRHSGPIAEKAAALSHGPNFYPARRYHRPYGAYFRTGAFENDPSAPAFTRLCAMHPATALTPACRQRHRAHFSAHLPGIRSRRGSCSGGRVYQRAPFGAHLCGSIADAAARFKNSA